MNKSIFNKGLVYLLVFIAGGTIVWAFTNHSYWDKKTTESTTVIQEKLKKVTKLITVEGYYSEIYNHNEQYDYDYFNFFSKKILLRVTAKVSAGFDFDKLNISIDSLSRTITLNELPQAEVLSIDHDIDYYDINTGIFTSFTTEEYNNINKEAKSFIANKKNTARLLEKAQQERDNYIQMIDLMLQSSGWKLVIKSNVLPN